MHLVVTLALIMQNRLLDNIWNTRYILKFKMGLLKNKGCTSWVGLYVLYLWHCWLVQLTPLLQVAIYIVRTLCNRAVYLSSSHLDKQAANSAENT